MALLLLLTLQPAYSQQRKSIRRVDFKNFTYPRWGRMKNGELQEKRSSFGRLVGGGNLADVSYGDVTGDGKEEAIVFITLVSGGSALPGEVYIYTMRNARPRLLWNFSTGDRADGGLHGIYADKGKLVVELNGPKRGIEPDCCPKRFTRTRYAWRGGWFRPIRKQTLPMPEPG
ncbi:MAG TPA: hypothetical protein VLJ61_17205 [Pyrinomonadaceae bacterium]|nr:hypothetical protein [Pyrinomonadaceae bacterium]